MINKDIWREINKAYIGFIGDRYEDKKSIKRVSTGNFQYNL